MTGGSVSSRSVNLFSRERELKELTEALRAGQEELERLLKRMRDGQAEKDRLKERSAGALEELHQQEIAVARETERLQNAEEDRRMHMLRRSETEAAREQLMESMMQIREQLSMAADNSAETDKTREEMEKQAAELQRELTAARQATESRAEETVRLTLEVICAMNWKPFSVTASAMNRTAGAWRKTRSGAAASWPRWRPRKRLI